MSSRLHIAHILPSFEWGGTQALIVQFAAQARDLDVDVTVISLAADRNTPYAQQLRELGANVIFLEGRYALSPARLLRLTRLLRRQNVDLVHAHLTKPNTVAPLAGWLARLPVVVGLHTLPNRSTFRARLRTMAEAFAVRRAARAISCANSIAREEVSRFAPTAIQVVSNPAPAADSIDRITVPSKPMQFIAVARLSPEKGYDTMLDAAAVLRARGHHFHLSIVGDGALRDMLAAKVEQTYISDYVTLLGPRNDVPSLLRASDVFLSASRFEGLSVAMLEAMGLGLPVVATDVGDTADVLTSSTGALVPPDSTADLADAMEGFIVNPARVAECGAAAHQLIKDTRAPHQWAQNYIAIYRETLASFGRQIA